MASTHGVTSNSSLGSVQFVRHPPSGPGVRSQFYVDKKNETPFCLGNPGTAQVFQNSAEALKACHHCLF